MERIESMACVTTGREKKNPRTCKKVRGFRFLSSGAHRNPVLEGPSRYGSMGRSSGFRIVLLAAPSHHACGVTVAISCGFCPRLQRRVRDGFAPSSLSPCVNRIEHPEFGVKKTVPVKAILLPRSKSETVRGNLILGKIAFVMKAMIFTAVQPL